MISNDQPPAVSPLQTTRRWSFPPPVAWAVLAISLAATGGGWFTVRQHEELSARNRFDEDAGRIAMALATRMNIYQDVLHGAVGLYAASYSVERSEWKAYVESVSIEKRFPGVDGLGFIACVPREKLDDFLRITREDKTPEFRLRNPSTNADFFIIKYLEPEEQYRELVGRDIGIDADRRAVAEKARDSGEATLSGNMTLLNGTRGRQSGLMMLLPVYRHGAATTSVAERRAGIEGWVYARFLTTQLMRGIFGADTPALHFQVFDDSKPDQAKLIFDNDPELTARHPGDDSIFKSELTIPLGGRLWSLRFTSQAAFTQTISRWPEIVATGGGTLVSLLLFGIVWSLGSTRERALQMASEMTTALREANEKLRREIIERQRSETAQKYSEILYHSLVESLPLQILRKDLSGRILFANQRFCDGAGKKLSDLLGKPDSILFPESLAARHQEVEAQVIAQALPVERVEEHPGTNGQQRFVLVITAPVRDGAGQVTGLLQIFSDITDKHQAEEALEHERFLLRTLMDNLPDRIYFKDRESRFLRNSRAHLERFGLTEARQAIGKTDFDFFSDEHARTAYSDEQNLMQTGRAITKEERETWPDGSVTWALSTKLPLRDEAGRVIGTFGISHDITARKNAEEALRVAKEAAEESSRTKSQFLASMSHELRTPLNSVIGFSNILLKNKNNTLTSGELTFLERIAANGKHLLSLINEILDLSKIEARKIELQIAPVALDELVRETVAQQEGLVRDKPVQLLAELPAAVAPFSTDADKLRQIIINLIGNALKFTERGPVTVRLVTDPDRHPLRIEVVDTGIGIPQEKLGLIFEAFQQAEAGTARKYGGTGLGLTISQALCSLMGYQIVVSSEVGRGSTFSILLAPAPTITAGSPTMAVPAKSPAPSAQSKSNLAGKRVLVIDDELDSRILLTHMVTECGCQVISASSGTQGLQMAREFRPDLITLDLMMPSMDGWQVIRAIKAEPELAHIPVVIVSVVAAENSGHIFGAVEVLQKPVARQELLDTLQRILPRPQPKILVVDDDPDVHRVIAAQLVGEVAEIRPALNGSEALALLEKFTPDLVLLDLMMPVMNGMSFLNALRRDPRYQQLPVVVITAKDLTVEEASQLKLETLRVLNKAEVFAGELKRVLEELLSANLTRPAERKSP